MRFAATCILVLATLFSIPSVSEAGHWHRWGRLGHHHYRWGGYRAFGHHHYHGWHPRTRIYSHHYYRPRYYSYSVPYYAYSAPYYRSYRSYCYPRYYSYSYAPVYVPAYSVGYGLSGVYSVTNTQSLLQRYAQPVTVPLAPAVPTQQPIEVRRSVPSAAALQLANKYISYGDRLFAEQRFQEALSRYKTAVLAAPGLPEAHFRKAHALVTVNQHDLALRAFNRGYQMLGEGNRGDFRLDDMYKDNRSIKTAHMERLAKAAIDNPRDAKPLLLLALSLHYNGEQIRAQKFFTRAVSMTTSYDTLAIRFLANQPKIQAIADARPAGDI